MEMRKSQLETLNEGDKIMTVKHAKLNLMNFVIITFSVGSSFGYLIDKKVVKKWPNFTEFWDVFWPILQIWCKNKSRFVHFSCLANKIRKIESYEKINLDSFLNFTRNFLILSLLSSNQGKFLPDILQHLPIQKCDMTSFLQLWKISQKIDTLISNIFFWKKKENCNYQKIRRNSFKAFFLLK